MPNEIIVHIVDDDLAVRQSLAFLLASDGIPVRLLLQRLDEPTVTVRAHLDLATTDRAATREVHRAAGAEVVSEHDFWTVMRDPVGRVYCLTDRRP